MKHQVLDLFAGIGGFSLGLEWAGGFETAAMCEIDEAACKVLSRHWPDVKIYNDIKELTGEQLQADEVQPSVITLGFPCQDISNAGKQAGIHGDRSSLWKEAFRLVKNVRPTWAVVENVSALRSKGLTLVLQDLSEIGYICEWHCVPACSVNAPHQRDRIWIIAHRDPGLEVGQAQEVRPGEDMADPAGLEPGGEPSKRQGREGTVGGGTDRRGTEEAGGKYRGIERYLREFLREAPPWLPEPDVGRVAHGIPHRVDRLKQLGNAVVPQIPMLIGLAIMEYEKEAPHGTL